MAFSRPADEVIFLNTTAEEHFNSLREDNWLKKALRKAIFDFKENAFCGDRIRKKLIPKEYVLRYRINNLLWYPLPNAWRLVYSIVSDNNKIIAAIVGYSDHKEYERRFHIISPSSLHSSVAPQPTT